jgi:D-3-phosphoglycerate dehydrogenase
MRLSRWGRSAYETDEDISAEAVALSEIVTVLPTAQDAEIVVVHSQIRFGAAQLDRAPSLRLLITTTSGTDHIDLAAMQAREVVVARLPLARRDAVGETTIGMLLWGLHRWGALDAAAREGTWARGELPRLAPRLLNSGPIGLVGLGVIGCHVAKLLLALGVEVWGTDPRGVPDGVRATPLEALLSDCAAVSLHCSLNPSSRGLIGESELAKCRRGLVLVNTARGGLVDTASAIVALDMGRLSALCLDVFEAEPHPRMNAVRGRPGLWLHPHAAGFHRDLSTAIRTGLMQAVGAFVRGKAPPHVVGSG